jgi:2-dehydropantoate 2-reductase
LTDADQPGIIGWMRILVVGAGAIGGYFGGRLLQAGRDVTFLVREQRAAQLRQSGLSICSKTEAVHLPDPPTILAPQLQAPFDLVLLSCKSYDLDQAVESIRPAVGSGSTVLPLLNGMRHLDTLEAAFGAEAVLGGRCFISAMLDQQGRILHLDENRALAFGARDGTRPHTLERILTELMGAGFDVQLSQSILQDMWDKWVFIAAAAAITCLMRAAVGDIIEAGGSELPLAMLQECLQTAAAAHRPVSAATQDQARRFLTQAGSTFTASMLRDIEAGKRTEVEQILGDLIARGGTGMPDRPLLELACTQIRAYEIRRARSGQAHD